MSPFQPSCFNSEPEPGGIAVKRLRIRGDVLEVLSCSWIALDRKTVCSQPLAADLDEIAHLSCFRISIGSGNIGPSTIALA